MNPSAKMLHQMFKTGEQEGNYADIAINENEISRIQSGSHLKPVLSQ